MGEVQGTLFRLDCNKSVQVEARPERLSSDAGVLLMRELSDRLGLPSLIGRYLTDARDPSRAVHPSVELVRTRVLALAQGWRDQNDVSFLRDDPTFRLAVTRGGARARCASHGGGLRRASARSRRLRDS